MKKIMILIVAVISVVSLSAFTSVDSVVNPVSNIVSIGLDQAVKTGVGTTEQANEIKDSKILELSYQEFMKTGDPQKAVDKAAEIAVEKGWFKDKQSAKKYCKKQLEMIRHDDNTCNKIYKMLGL